MSTGPLSAGRIRKELRQKRRSISASQRQQAARSVRRLVVRERVFQRARKLAMYMEAHGEVDPMPLLETAVRLDKACYLPVLPAGLMPRTVSRLLFQRFDPRRDRLAVNRYGILEPAYNPQYLIAPHLLDLVLMPLVAFDRDGNRLGMGKGFYDRTFAGIRSRWRRPVLLGMAYAMQEVDALAPAEWDVPMDGIVTEKEIIWTKPGRD